MSEIKIEQRRLFDWRLMISVIALIAVLFGTYAGAESFRSGDVKDRNTAALVSEIRVKDRTIAELITAYKAQSVASDVNAAKVADNQNRMLRFQAAEVAWTKRILTFVRTHPGQQPPVSLLEGSPIVPTLQTVNGSAKVSKHSVKKSAKPSKKNG